MKTRCFIQALFAVFILASFFLGACTQAATPAATPATAPAAAAPASGQTTIRVAVLPILDALPMYVAQQEGLFKAHGVNVEFIPSASAAERDQVVAAGQADALINEIVSTILYNKDKTQVQIVRFARSASKEDPMYRILASGKSGITNAEGLKGIPIGISQGTVIDYITDRLLQAEGLSKDDIKKIPVPKIGDRMALLGTGELKAATLPDPLASLAIEQGAKVILDDTSHPELGYSTIAFRKPFIDQNPEAVKGFLAAIEEATTQINQNPEKWSNLLTEQKLVPASIVGAYKIPKMVTASVPTEAQWDDVLAWEKENNLVSKDISYQESVNANFLP